MQARQILPDSQPPDFLCQPMRAS